MNIHSLAITALFGAATAAKSTTRERKAFLAEMKNANLALHPSERSLTKDETPSIETFSEIINGDSARSKHYREKIIKKAKFVSPEEIQAREAAEASGRHLEQNGYASGAYNYNNAQGVSSLYAEDSNGDAFVSSGNWNNAFGFDPTDYSFAYLRCAEVRQFDDELAAMEDSPSVFSTRHFAVFRFCPTVTCEGMTANQIEKERQAEYSAWVAANNQANADNQAAAYASARSGDVYSAYNAQMYVKQQAEAAQAAGELYEPPSWVFDKRIIGGADGSGCSSNYGEYMLELEDYLSIMLEYHQDRFETYCDYCDGCMYAVYQNWLKQNQNRELKMKSINEDWQADLERHLNEDEIRRLGNVYGTCPEYDTCKYYQKTCGNQLDDTLTQYFECTEVERNNGMVAYIGPHCGSDGKTVTLGLYSDENCNEFIGGSTNINNFLGFNLEEGALDGYVTGSLARDIIPDDYFEQYWSEELQAYYNPQEQMCIPCAASLQIYETKGNVYNHDGGDDDYHVTNNAYDGEVNDLCTNMYLASARCDKHYKSYSSSNKNSKMTNYYANQDLSCEFIQSVVEGNYNEMGFVNIDTNTTATGNILTNSIYYEEYGHYIQEVSPLQIFGLCASILACAILALWAGSLKGVVSNVKAPWRPRRGVNTAAIPASRQDSGIALNRSATMERGRSTSSYYMT